MAFDNEMEYYRYTPQEESGASWLVAYSLEDATIARPCFWADKYNSLLFTSFYGYKSFNTAAAGIQAQFLLADEYNLDNNGFFFNTMLGAEYHRDQFYDFEEIYPRPNLESRSIIYDSGGSVVFHQEDCNIDERFLDVTLR